MLPSLRLTVSALVALTIPLAGPSMGALAATPASAASQPVQIPPFKAGSRYFFVATDGALYVRDGFTAPARLILPQGTFGTVTASPNGEYLAYEIPGSERAHQVRIRDIRTNRDIGEALVHARLAPHAWTHNNRGFVYVRVDTASGRERIYYHTIGQPSASDVVLMSREDQPQWMYEPRITDDGQYVVITIRHSIDSNTRIYFIDLANPGKPSLNAPVVRLIDEFSAQHTFVDNARNAFLLMTNWKAPRGQIILASTDEIRPDRWPPVIPSSSDSLVLARTSGQRFLITGFYTRARATSDSTSARADSTTPASNSQAADTSGEPRYITRIYVSPTEKEQRDAMRARMDSIRKAGGRRGRDGDRGDTTMRGGRAGGRPDPNAPRPTRMIPGLRLTLRSELPIPAGSTILSMYSNAEDDELFYVLKLENGATQAYMYNVDSRKAVLFDTTAPVTAGTTASATLPPQAGTQ